jgi:hypothetical protein
MNMMKLIKLNFILTASLAVAFVPCLYGQNYLSEEREIEIKMSGKYYYAGCANIDPDEAKRCALFALGEKIIKNVVNQSLKQDEVLKELEMSAHLDNLQQEGRTEILAWIAKDSVFVTAKKTVVKQTSEPAPKPAPIQPAKEEVPTIVTANPVLKELAACKTFKDVRRIATMNGVVICGELNNLEGCPYEKCIIAVFATDKALIALFDTGGNSRTDLLSGKMVQNPEQHYNREQYYLWYLLKENN